MIWLLRISMVLMIAAVGLVIAVGGYLLWTSDIDPLGKVGLLAMALGCAGFVGFMVATS